MSIMWQSGIFSQGTATWNEVTKGMIITAYEPYMIVVESELVEPGQAVNLPPAERARMNYAQPGVVVNPEHI
jgi:hypothetical protein